MNRGPREVCGGGICAAEEMGYGFKGREVEGGGGEGEKMAVVGGVIPF